MAEEAKPAGGNGGHREITIRDWKPLFKNTLRGFFSVDLPSGLRIHSLSLHQKGGAIRMITTAVKPPSSIKRKSIVVIRVRRRRTDSYNRCKTLKSVELGDRVSP